MSEEKKEKKTEVVTDFLGRPIAVKKTDHNGKTTVTSWVGKPKGEADKRGTRDFIGKPKAIGNHPDMLIDDEDDE